MDWTHEEIKAHGRDVIEAAMRRRGHLPGVVRTSRTSRGTWYTYTRCANVQGRLQCSTEAEYSVERGKVTQSTVAYWCQYETADQKLDRQSAAPHWHVERNGDTLSWAWIATRQKDAQRLVSEYKRAGSNRKQDRYTMRQHEGPCGLFREYLTHWTSGPTVTEV